MGCGAATGGAALAYTGRTGTSRGGARDVAEASDERTVTRELEIAIPPGPRLGDKVIEVTGLRKGYGDRLLIEDLTFQLPRSGIVGIIGITRHDVTYVESAILCGLRSVYKSKLVGITDSLLDVPRCHLVFFAPALREDALL